MAHIRGHIIKKGNESTQLNNKNPLPQEAFFHYRFIVSDFQGEEQRFKDSHSYEPDLYNRNIVFLSKENSLDMFVVPESTRNLYPTVNLVLETQDHFDYSKEWSLDGKSNWMVYDRDDQSH